MGPPDTRLLPNMLAAPLIPARRYYMKGAQVSIKLRSPRSRSHILNMKMPQRLLNLYIPSLMATNLYQNRRTGARTLPLNLPPLSAVTEIDIPALERMLNYLKGLMCTNSEWNTLPRISTIKHCILTYRACEILNFTTGASNVHSTLICMLDKQELSADEVRDMWLAFRESNVLMEAMARNIAKFTVHGKSEDEEYIEWFLITDEIPDEEREVMRGRIRGYLDPHRVERDVGVPKRCVRGIGGFQDVIFGILNVC